MGLTSPISTHMTTGEQYAAGASNGRLPCMIGHADQRSLVISLTDGRPIQFEETNFEVGQVDAKKVIDRYGEIHKDMFGPPGADEEEVAASLFRTAQKVFLRDGYHQSIFFLLRKQKLVSLVALNPHDQRDKYLMMRGLAIEVARHGADAVVALNEAWTAPADPKRPYMHAAKSPDRRELLMATLVRKNGEPVQFSVEIRREGKALQLGETRKDYDFAPFSYAPIYRIVGPSYSRQLV